MSLETLERVIRGTFELQAQKLYSPKCDFIWHGGEPLVPGLAFYEAAVEMQRRLSGSVAYDNTVQTNGLLINEAWIEFFKRENFRVSISIDGPKHINDRTRIDLRGRGTFERIKKSFDQLRAAGIPFGVCIVLTRANTDDVEDIFEFLKVEKLPFNIIPLTLSGAAKGSFGEIGLAPGDYADPWIKMYDLWFDASAEDYSYCSDFAFKTQAILNGRPADCIGQKNCSNHHVSTDPDGWVYPCATLSGNPEWAYGNVNDSDLKNLMASDVALRAQRREIDPQCAECKWQHVCHGGCMQRAFKFSGDHNQRDYYCPSLYQIYEHVEKRLRADGSLDLSKLPSPSRSDRKHLPETSNH